METKKHIFSVIEKKHFINILHSFKHIIENKETDAHTMQIKNNAWEEITREYNASPHCTYQVSTKQLRRLWLNLKQRQREALTKERQHRMATGGGPAISDVMIDPEIAALAPALLVSVENPIDSDTASEVTNHQPLSQPVELAISTDPIDLPSTQIIYSIPENTHIVPSRISSFPSSTQISLNTPQTLPTSTLLHPIPTTSQVQPIPSTSQPQLQTQINPDQANPSLIPTTSAPTDRQSTTIRRRQSVIAQKCAILDKEFKNRAKMQSELHEFQKQLLNEQIREAKSKATYLDQIHHLQKQLLQEQIREAKLKADLIERKLLQGQDPETEQ